ncbi:MAG: hypothetical protein R3314_02640 [Longimicrobiales bacterium]|nr:hypothetical protein [Longimicrobiales bacterium]
MKQISRMIVIVTLPALAVAACGEQEPGEEEMQVDTTRISVTNPGFDTPESILHDTDADVYLVSNIGGAPTAEDGNGFISRVAPNGEVAALKWIDGQVEGTTLNAPKGMAILGDTLYVSDITAVRAFHRVTGEPLGSWPVEGSTFLNDLAVGPDGMLYVSDSGLNADFTGSGTDAVYRFENGEPVAVVQDTTLAAPNGLAVRDGTLVIVSFGAPEIRTVPASGGEVTVTRTLPGGQLDGVVVLEDGSLLVSSWETSAVYHVPADIEPMTVLEGVPSPADIGWDAERSRLLVPVFNENRLVLEKVVFGMDHDD